MMQRKLGGFVVAALAAAFIMGASSRADAAFIAWICNDVQCIGGGDVVVTDNGAGDGSGVAGAIVAAGSVGGLTTTINISTSKPILTQPSMDLAFQAAGVGEVWFYASDTDFTTIAPLFGTLDGNFSGTGSVQASIYGGTNNDSGTLTAPVFSAILTSSPFHTTLTHGAATTSPYSLTIGVHVIRTSAGITTGDFLVVPEPATMALFGMGLVGYVARRRRLAV